jgi:hypothetical protein
MKIKIILTILCLTIPALLFSGCKVKDKGDGDDQSCTHNYVEGICGICGESDPNYTPDEGTDDKDEQKPEEDNSKIPPINTDGETELPFVPAK